MVQANSPALMQSKMQAANLQARNLILNTAVDAWQQIFTQTYTSGQGTVINVPLRNVGLIKRLIVKVAATISGTSSHTQSLTKLGMANFFSNITLTDLSNQQRISTTGWHLMAVSTAKSRFPFAAANTSTDTPLGYGNNFTTTMTAPSTITASASNNNCFAVFEVPLAYSDTDLRGAIYASVVNATMNLQLTVNANMLLASGTDPVSAVYQAGDSTVATLPSFTVTVYQNYLDQLPMGQNGPVLPYLDLSVAYLLNNTALSGLVAAQDFAIPYANFRDFLSTTVIYDNNGTLNAGTDINYFALQTANYTNLFKVTPDIVSFWNRLRIHDDYPLGTYYFDHRKKPISTIQYGNMQLNVNPSSVNSPASLLVGFESMALIAQITGAGSLPSN